MTSLVGAGVAKVHVHIHTQRMEADREGLYHSTAGRSTPQRSREKVYTVDSGDKVYTAAQQSGPP